MCFVMFLFFLAQSVAGAGIWRQWQSTKGGNAILVGQCVFWLVNLWVCVNILLATLELNSLAYLGRWHLFFIITMFISLFFLSYGIVRGKSLAAMKWTAFAQFLQLLFVSWLFYIVAVCGA